MLKQFLLIFVLILSNPFAQQFFLLSPIADAMHSIPNAIASANT